MQSCHLGSEYCGKRRRKRRENEQTIILPDDRKTGIYDYNPVQPTFAIKDFPTPSGINLTDAQSKCENALRNSQIGEICLKTIVGLNITGMIKDCVTDVKVWLIF